MTNNQTTNVTMVYESPKCDIVDIKAEGVLCASLEQFNEDNSDFTW